VAYWLLKLRLGSHKMCIFLTICVQFNSIDLVTLLKIYLLLFLLLFSSSCGLAIFISAKAIRDHVRFEDLTVLTMKNTVFLDVMPCGFCKNRRFGGM
jgi:hypothetical protein